MIIDVLFENAMVFDVQSRIDVRQGQVFTLIMDNGDGIDVFANNDKVLSLDHTATDVVVTAEELGESYLRFMTGDTTTRKVLIRVVSEFHRPAKDLGLEIGEPQPK